MTAKRFILKKNTGTDECYLYDDGVYIGEICGGSEMICFLLNILHEKNEQLQKMNQGLKEALLFYLDVATGLSSSNFQYDMEKWCNILLDCSYDEAKRKYGDFKYTQRWELE